MLAPEHRKVLRGLSLENIMNWFNAPVPGVNVDVFSVTWEIGQQSYHQFITCRDREQAKRIVQLIFPDVHSIVIDFVEEVIWPT